MKTLKFTGLLLSVLIINSCAKTIKEVEVEEEKFSAHNGFYIHRFFLSFQDASGNDLVKGIGVDTVSANVFLAGDPAGGNVSPYLYTLEIDFEDGIPNISKPSSIYYSEAVTTNYNNNIYNNSYYKPFPMYLLKAEAFEWQYPDVAIDGNYDYLRFYILGSPVYNGYENNNDKKIPFSEKITFTLKCPHLFGDNEAHEIITWWKPNEERVFYTICYRIEFGGKKFTEIITNEYATFSVATLVLDR